MLKYTQRLRTVKRSEALDDRFVPINDSSLLGTVEYAYGGKDMSAITEKAEYVDLGSDVTFTELLFEKMSFCSRE